MSRLKCITAKISMGTKENLKNEQTWWVREGGCESARVRVRDMVARRCTERTVKLETLVKLTTWT